MCCQLIKWLKMYHSAGGGPQEPIPGHVSLVSLGSTGLTVLSAPSGGSFEASSLAALLSGPRKPIMNMPSHLAWSALTTLQVRRKRQRKRAFPTVASIHTLDQHKLGKTAPVVFSDYLGKELAGRPQSRSPEELWSQIELGRTLPPSLPLHDGRQSYSCASVYSSVR